MKLVVMLVVSLGIAVVSGLMKTTTWLIDGDNLRCSRGVPSYRTDLIRELKIVASPKSRTHEKQGDKISNVVLVFDGKHNETFHSTTCPDTWFECIITDGRKKEKDRADTFIVNHVMPKIKEEFEYGDIHVVTADRELQKRARATGCMKRGSTVCPQKFWKQYLPVLQENSSRRRSNNNNNDD